MKYDKNNNSIRFLDTFYVIWPSFIHKFVFVWVLWRNKVLGKNFGSKCYVIFFRKWVLGKSMWDTYNYFFLIFQKKFKYYTPRAKFKKKLKNFARIWVKLTMLLFVRTYPISLGKFGLRFFLRHEPPRPPKIFFSAFFF